MKNVPPHDLEKIQMPYGKYTATIIGDDYNIQKEFIISSKDEVIQLY